MAERDETLQMPPRSPRQRQSSLLKRVLEVLNSKKTSYLHREGLVQTPGKSNLSPLTVRAVVSGQIRGDLSICLDVLLWQPP